MLKIAERQMTSMRRCILFTNRPSSVVYLAIRRTTAPKAVKSEIRNLLSLESACRFSTKKGTHTNSNLGKANRPIVNANS